MAVFRRLREFNPPIPFKPLKMTVSESEPPIFTDYYLLILPNNNDKDTLNPMSLPIYISKQEIHR